MKLPEAKQYVSLEDYQALEQQIKDNKGEIENYWIEIANYKEQIEKLKADRELLLEYFKLTRAIVNLPEDNNDLVRLLELMEWINAYLRTEGIKELKP